MQVILVAGALSTISQRSGAQLSPVQRDSIEVQVQAALDSLTDAWRRWDVDGMMRFYLDSALIAGNGRLSSQDAHRAASARRTGVLGQRIGPFRQIRFDVLSRDAVVVSWLNTFAVIDTGRQVRPAMVAATTDVWVRRGRGWRILVQHESTRIAPDSVAPPPPAHGAQSDQLDELLQDVPQLPVEHVVLDVHPRMTLEKISAVTADSHGNIYIIHRPADGDPIVVLDPQGDFVRSWGKGMFTMPHGIRIDPDGNVWTLDAHTSTIYKFTPEGKQLLEVRVGDVPDTARAFCGATDIAFANTGRVFVSDGYCNARVIEYDAAGTKLHEWGAHGTGPGEFNVVHSIAISPSGVLYVADRENGRIQRFDQRGTFLGAWRYSGRLYAVAFGPMGELYAGIVARGATATSPDTAFNVIRIDPASGKILGKFAARAHELGVAPDGTLLPATLAGQLILLRPRK